MSEQRPESLWAQMRQLSIAVAQEPTCPRCMHGAHEPGDCGTPSMYGCRECGPRFMDCPGCSGAGCDECDDEGVVGEGVV